MWKVRMYMNTGFNTVNVPDSEATLNSAAESHTDFPVIDCLQRYFLSSIKIRAYEDQVIQGDYLKLWDEQNSNRFAFYVILGYTMTSGDTIELSIVMDPLLTCGGVDNIEFLDGMTSRCNDKIEFGMRNVEDDPLLVPRNLHLFCLGEYFGDDYNYTPGGASVFHFGSSSSLMFSSMYNIFAAGGVELESGVDVEVTENSWEGSLISTPVIKDTVQTTSKTLFRNNYGGNQVDYFATADGNSYWLFNSDQTGVSIIDTLVTRCEKLLRYGRQDLVNDAYYVPTRLAVNNVSIVRNSEAQSQALGAINICKWVAASKFVYSEGLPYFVYSQYGDAKYACRENLERMYPNTHNQRALMGRNFDFVFCVRDSGDTKRMNAAELFYALSPYQNSEYIPKIMVSVDLRPDGHVEYGVCTENNNRVEQGWQNPPNVILKSGTWEKARIFTKSAVGVAQNAAMYALNQQLADRMTEVNIAHDAMKSSYVTGAVSEYLTANTPTINIGTKTNGVDPLATFNIGMIPGAVADLQSAPGQYKIGQALNARTAAMEAGNFNALSMSNEAGAGNDVALAMMNRDVERAREKQEFINANYPTVQVIAGGGGGSTLSTGHGLLLYRYLPSADDVERFDRILNQFGCKVTLPTEKKQLKNRTLYNYIEASSVSIKCETVPRSVRNDLANMFSSGLRIWHTDPKDHNYREENAYVNA